MTMKKIVLANLKAYRSPRLVGEWCDALLSALGKTPDTLEVVLALPDMALGDAADKIGGHAGFSLAAQALSPFPQGSYTGATPAAWLKGCRLWSKNLPKPCYTGATPAAWLKGLVRYTLAGHRERRCYFHESVQDVAREVAEALDEAIRPIVCVESGTFAPQLAALRREEQEQVFWAFTPRVTMPLQKEDLETIAKSVAHIRRQSDDRPVLYGGGVHAGNARSIWAIEGLGGLMLGEACHNASAFARIVESLG